MRPFADEVTERLQDAFGRHADPERAVAMSAYMRAQFPFLGLPSPVRRTVTREALAGLKPAGEHDIVEALARLWALPEREYQYAGADLAVRYIALCGPSSLARLEHAIVTRPWWDTVDTLAAHCVGPLVQKYPQLTKVMDRWAADEDMWRARTAILHQLRAKDATDEGRLFSYCLLRAADREFFIRKAIGWALREYSKSNGEAVRQFVTEHEAELSGLSRREALLWLDRREARE